ncbi:MAG: GGDEF domain-containing protein [Rubrobacteraceae bacterium]
MDISRISEEIGSSAPEVRDLWKQERDGASDEERYAELVGGIERLIVVFAEFLRSPESTETFSRRDATRALVGEIAGYQHGLGRDAVGVIDDFMALRRSIWRFVQGRLNLSELGGNEVAAFSGKLMEASDWVTEAGLAAFDDIVHEEMQEALGQAAATDLLTGLPDRDLLSRLLLPRAIDENERLAVMVFDIAGFSESVAAGEVAYAREAISLLSEAILGTMPETATCGRFGDDEICAFVPGVGGEDAYRLAEKVIEELNSGPGDFQIDVGVAEYPTHVSGVGDLVNEMLRALKMAQRVGGGGIVVAHRRY